MAKTKKVQRVKIYSKIFTGYSDDMPEAAKAELLADNPKLYKNIFGDVQPTVEEVIN